MCLCVCECADLRQCEERGELLVPVLFFLLVVLSVVLYFAVSLMDPGFVLTDTVQVRLTNKTRTTKAKQTHVSWKLCVFLSIYCSKMVTVQTADSQTSNAGAFHQLILSLCIFNYTMFTVMEHVVTRSHILKSVEVLKCMITNRCLKGRN